VARSGLQVIDDNQDLLPGVPAQLAAGALRIVAPNASAMTGPRTNSFVLDPGPDIDSRAAVLQRIAPQLRYVFGTHTHRDHSPPADGRQDESFVPDLIPERDQCFDLGGLSLRAIDTPGHASNHVCYLLEPPGLLFSGDHILDGVTPVILAPDGDIAAYLDSLQRLQDYSLGAIAPGHGRVLGQPLEVIDAIVAHRLRREARVLAALGMSAGATLEQLLPQVYSEVRPELMRWARLSLQAHLIKLAREQRASLSGELWRLQEPP